MNRSFSAATVFLLVGYGAASIGADPAFAAKLQTLQGRMCEEW